MLMPRDTAVEADRTGVLDEAYQRLHQTGPEFEGWLSNHGAMATEALVRLGHERRVHPSLDAIADAALTRYADYAHGNPVMLVHSATAPSAVQLALPALPHHDRHPPNAWRPPLPVPRTPPRSP